VVNNRSDNNFWFNIEKNIRDMLRAPTSRQSGRPAGRCSRRAGGAPGSPQRLRPAGRRGAALGAALGQRNSTANSVIVNPKAA
jgi:general secretion pathway protein D